MDRALTEDRIAFFEDYDAETGIGKDIAALEGPLASLIHRNANAFPIMDRTVAERRIALFVDCYPETGITKDIALLDHASPVIGNEKPDAHPIEEAATTNRGMGCNVLDRDTGERVGGNVAVFKDELSLGNVDAVVFLVVPARSTTQRQTSHAGKVGLHQKCIGIAAFENNVVFWSITDDLDGFVQQDSFVIGAGSNQDALVGFSVPQCCGEGGIVSIASTIDDGRNSIRLTLGIR